MSSACPSEIIGGQTCVRCPAVEAVEAVPDQTLSERILGWNSSARSVESVSGDCYVEFNLPPSVGVVCGLTSAHTGHDPRTVEFGFYVFELSGRRFYQVVESGTAVTSAAAYTPSEGETDGDVLRIERDSNGIRYFVNGALDYVSAQRSSATMFVVACLYASDDGVN